FGTLTDVTAQKQLDSELKKYRDAIADNRKECRTIMIVDDVELNRVILREIFVGQYKVIEAVNGEDALIKLQKENNNVDIILLDLMMPVMDGHEFLNIKKSVPEIAGIPVIIITADDSKEQQINTLALGANDYIVKPFIQEIVVRRVNNVIESNRRFREVLKEYNNVLQ
ncbi:MAG: response regulator, partial [Oscillospiraceae bacterium]